MKRVKVLRLVAGTLLGLAEVAALPPASAAEPSIRMSSAAQRNEGVGTIAPRMGSLRGVIPAMAHVETDGARSVMIRPAGDGKVLQVLVTPGQTVRQGQTLLTYVDHSLHVLALQESQARAGLNAAQAVLGDAQAAYQRGRSLAGGAVATGEVQRRSAVVQEDRDAVTARNADIGTIEHRLREEFTSPTERIIEEETSALISPVNGVVQAVSVGVATDIGPQMVVAQVVDLSSVWVVADIRPEEATRLAIGARMRLRPAGDADAPAAQTTIATIDGMANPTTGLVRVVGIATSGSGMLRPGTMLDAEIDTTHQATGLIVPVAALQHFGEHDVVFVHTEPETFESRTVRVRLQAGQEAVVDGDLGLSDQVVSDGAFWVKSAALASDASEN